MLALLTTLALAAAETPPSPEAPTETPAVDATDLCFSPDEDCAARLVEFLGRAKKSIDVAIYDVNEVRIVHQLSALALRLPVRIVVDQRQAKGSHSAVPELMNRKGLELRFGRQRGIFHDKFVIVDGAAVETGSFNFTNHATRANQENQVYLRDPRVAARFRERFEKIWSSARASSVEQSVTKAHARRPRRPASYHK